MDDRVRLIDGDALKAKFCNHCDERDCKPDATDTVYGCVIADTIDNMPTIEAKPDNGWIGVEDELPNISTTTHTSQLVMVYSTDNEYEMYFDVYNGLSGRFMSEAQNECKVTYWRPLPEPPKGE